MTAVCLRILQAALVNALMLQDVLAGEPWADLFTSSDQRGLTPLFWTHVRPTEKSTSTWPSAWRSGIPPPAKPSSRD